MQHIIHGPPRRRSSEPGALTATMPPLVLGQLVREWEFSELRGDSLEEVMLDHGIQVGDLVHQLYDFGPAFRDGDVFFPDGTSLPSDGIANGQIASTGDGVTYWVGAEAPAGIAGLPEDPIGGRAVLRQTQSLRKLASDASMSFTLSAAFIETTDQTAPSSAGARRCTPMGCSATWSRGSCT